MQDEGEICIRVLEISDYQCHQIGAFAPKQRNCRWEKEEGKSTMTRAGRQLQTNVSVKG